MTQNIIQENKNMVLFLKINKKFENNINYNMNNVSLKKRFPIIENNKIHKNQGFELHFSTK